MISSCNSTKGSYHTSSQQFTLGGVRSKIVNCIQRLLKFFSNSWEPPLSTSAPCSSSRQDPSIPWIVLRTPRNILLGRPPVVPAFTIHPGASQQKWVLFRAWARSESSWHGFASRRSVPRGTGLTVTRVSFEPRSHPQEENQSFNYYASTVRLLYPRHKVTTLGKKKSWLKCSIMLTPLCYLEHDSDTNNAYHWAAYWDFSTLPRSCQEKGKHYSSSMHGYDRLFFFLKIEKYF